MDERELPLGIYIHVPFCAARCGYCDFNTYVPSGPGQPSEYVEAALLRDGPGPRRARASGGSTVFIGGGTPTLLGASELLRLLDGVRRRFGLLPGRRGDNRGEPGVHRPGAAARTARGGFTRVSLGMQSAAPHVLRTLDRVHTPGRATAAAIEAREAGFEHVSLDLIYGTPGETDADWERTLEAAVGAEPDHLATYALTVEQGTAMARAVSSGALAAPDDADQARRFAYADEFLSEQRLRLVRAELLGDEPRGALPPQHRLLALIRLVGDRPRSALPRRRRSLVERAAPGRICRAAARGPFAGAGT